MASADVFEHFGEMEDPQMDPQHPSKRISIRRRMRIAGYDADFLTKMLVGVWCVSPTPAASRH